ncbi:MAG TPA: flagellar type III secretion system pore protein FliP [bacterium]|nr:flagellar type III secretion system pore protein FliP [bacterium]
MLTDAVLRDPGMLLLIFGMLSLAPFILIMTTAFVKLSAVLSILRSALGTSQIPPNTVITGLSVILSILIMLPVVDDIHENMKASGMNVQTNQGNTDLKVSLENLYACAEEPLRGFLRLHTHPEEEEMLRRLIGGYRTAGESAGNDSDIILVTAFVLSELKEAFQIGFLVFLPFIIIDMIVANILQAMGMVMLSPTTISLPFKLLLFVLSDGWHLLIEGLVAGYFV